MTILNRHAFSVSLMPSGSPLVAHFSSLNSRCDATEIVKNIYKYIYMYRYIYIRIYIYIYI